MLSKNFISNHPITLFFALFICYSCAKENLEHDKFITSLRAEVMIKELLPNSIISRSRVQGQFLIRYFFSADSIYYWLDVGVQKNAEDAARKVSLILNDISAVYNEGYHNGNIIGDKFWWDTTIDTSVLSGIIFIRYNTLFYLGCFPETNKLEQFASNIDKAILSSAKFLTIESRLVQPEIDSVKATDDTLKMGESNTITVYAHDPRKAKLFYSAFLSHKADSIFIFKAMPSYGYGTHYYSFSVINEFNVVSDEKSIGITVVE
jgi:hypothetical protein